MPTDQYTTIKISLSVNKGVAFLSISISDKLIRNYNSRILIGIDCGFPDCKCFLFNLFLIFSAGCFLAAAFLLFTVYFGCIYKGLQSDNKTVSDDKN